MRTWNHFLRGKSNQMENIAPPLICVLEIQSSLANGESIRSGFLKYTNSVHDSFSDLCRKFLFAWDRGQNWSDLIQNEPSSYRRILLELIASGMSGMSIQSQLKELQSEIERGMELEIKRHIELLPLKLMVPLLLFQFPAFLLLLFGPILNQLLKELNR